MNFPGLVEMHVHTAPDVRPRRHNDAELAQLARSASARAVVLKSHHVPTMERARQAELATPGVKVMGAIVLNLPQGGLDAAVVESALEQGARVVWLPTLHAENHRRREGHSDGIVSVRGGRVVPAAEAIFARIAAADAILATGHLSADEIPVAVAAAWACGVRKIVVTHPEHQVVGMDIEAQRVLLRNFPVYFERCYAQPVGGGRYANNLETNLQAIQALGAASTILATDAGQVENSSWDECWAHIVRFLRSAGVSESELTTMCVTNPSLLLGLAD